MRLPRRVIVIGGVICLLTSCGGSSMNRSQAISRVRQLASETAHAIAPGLPTEVRPGDPTVGGCGPEFGNKVNVGYDLLLPHMSSDRSQEILRAAKAYFEKRGFTINSFEPSARAPVVGADTSDGFHIVYVIATEDRKS